MKRVVIDTNILVGSAYNEGSAGRRIVEACLRGELIAIVSPAVRREYEHIIPRAVRNREEADRIATLISRAEPVEPTATPRVVAEDPNDDKFFAAAVAGAADAVITNDRQMLDLNPYHGIRILRPSEFEQQRP